MHHVPEPTYRLNVTDGIQWAMTWSRYVLFQTGGFKKWVAFGLIVLLEQCGRGGGGGAGNFPTGGPGQPMPELEPVLEHPLFIPAVVIGGLLLLVIWLFFTWLGSRFSLVFVRAVAHNSADLPAHWSDTARAGNRYFLFRVAIAIIITVFMAAGAGAAWLASGGFTEMPPASFFVLAVSAGVLLVILALLVESFTRNLVIPLMWKHGIGPLAGWGVLLRIMAGNIAQILVFLLLRIVIALVIGVAALIAGFFIGCICLGIPGMMLFFALMAFGEVSAAAIVTGAIGGLLMLAIYIVTILGLTTVLAPLHVFERAYSLAVLESLGPGFEMFERPTMPWDAEEAQPWTLPEAEGPGEGAVPPPPPYEPPGGSEGPPGGGPPAPQHDDGAGAHPETPPDDYGQPPQGPGEDLPPEDDRR